LTERTGLFKFGGADVTLQGNPVGPGDKAPDFGVIRAADGTKVSLKDFAGKVLVIASVPSLDTGVCSTETRRFNQEASNLSSDVNILTVSCDLPYAQKRWCGAEGVDRITVASDHYDTSFGLAYGVLMKEKRLLARAVWVVGKDGKVTYHQLCAAAGVEPDYEQAIAAAKALV